MSSELALQAASKLEPFFLVGKSARGAAASKLIQDATAAPGVFVFAELLDLPNIQELQDSEQYAPYLRMLEYFAYGTYQEYMANSSTLPPLNPAQQTKLQHLSLVSLAATHGRTLPYSLLLPALGLSDVRTLEDLVIDAIYADLLHAKLDTRAQRVEVESTLGRDLAPGQVELVLKGLQDWASTTATVLMSLDDKLTVLARREEDEAKRKDMHEQALQLMLKDVKEKGKLRQMPFMVPGESDRMEIDEEYHHTRSPASKGKSRGLPDALGGLKGRKRNKF